MQEFSELLLAAGLDGGNTINFSFGKIVTNLRRGNESSAAGGRFSETSEWQRSKKSRESVSPKIFSGTATGHPNQNCSLKQQAQSPSRCMLLYI